MKYFLKILSEGQAYVENEAGVIDRNFFPILKWVIHVACGLPTACVSHTETQSGTGIPLILAPLACLALIIVLTLLTLVFALVRVRWWAILLDGLLHDGSQLLRQQS